jgi:hypothetical protein
MFRISIGVARFALSAWVGAAALFVVTGVSEVRAPELDSYVRDILVGVRFPAYYVFGFTLVGLAALATFAAALSATVKPGRQWCLAAIVIFSLLVMAVDYVWVYQPLFEMITPPGQSRPAEFMNYHTASKWMNLGSICLCALAAITLCGQNGTAET